MSITSQIEALTQVTSPLTATFILGYVAIIFLMKRLIDWLGPNLSEKSKLFIIVVMLLFTYQVLVLVINYGVTSVVASNAPQQIKANQQLVADKLQTLTPLASNPDKANPTVDKLAAYLSTSGMLSKETAQASNTSGAPEIVALTETVKKLQNEVEASFGTSQQRDAFREVAQLNQQNLKDVNTVSRLTLGQVQPEVRQEVAQLVATPAVMVFSNDPTATTKISAVLANVGIHSPVVLPTKLNSSRVNTIWCGKDTLSATREIAKRLIEQGVGIQQIIGFRQQTPLIDTKANLIQIGSDTTVTPAAPPLTPAQIDDAATTSCDVRA